MFFLLRIQFETVQMQHLQDCILLKAHEMHTYLNHAIKNVLIM